MSPPVLPEYRALKGLGFTPHEDNSMERGRIKVWSPSPRVYVVATYQRAPIDPKTRPVPTWLRRWSWVVVARGLTWHAMMERARHEVAKARTHGRLDDWWHRPALAVVVSP